ncbi:MAG: glutathione S-transferase [Acetobacteraceae bacterium]|nr:glutathione S-transferase [Acetobacteraceae bacterium]
MGNATLLINSRNYGAWSLRGFLLTRLSGLLFEEKLVSTDDPASRAELLLKSSSILLPCLLHDGLAIWDTMAIAEYLNETRPDAGMYPANRAARARCRSISGEMHSGFSALRTSLPMNLRTFKPGFTIWSAAQADIDRIAQIWRECADAWGGPWLFGTKPSVADAMYAPVVTRLRTYDVAMDAVCAEYCRQIMSWPDMQEWVAAAKLEPEQIEELDIEF